MKRAEEEWRREEDRAAAAEMVAFGFPRADATDELKRRERARNPYAWQTRNALACNAITGPGQQCAAPADSNLRTDRCLTHQ